MKRWELVALVLGQLLAAVALFLAGMHFANVGRYHGCTLAALGPELFYACPVRATPPPATGDPA